MQHFSVLGNIFEKYYKRVAVFLPIVTFFATLLTLAVAIGKIWCSDGAGNSGWEFDSVVAFAGGTYIRAFFKISATVQRLCLLKGLEGSNLT